MTEIKTCGECPYHDDGYMSKKTFCLVNDMAVDKSSIPENCPKRGKEIKWPEVK